MKICKKCEVEKDIESFYKSKSTSDGYRGTCIDCHKKYSKDNIKKIVDRAKRHKSENKDHYKEYYENYYNANKDKLKLDSRNYYNDNKEKYKEKRKEYRENHTRESKEYRIKNSDRLREKRRQYEKARKEKDPIYKFICSVRSLISSSIRKSGFSKKSKTCQILGCTFEEFKIHIESQFDENMTWENYGRYWQIDHIYPISKFENEEHLLLLNSYNNLRPLEASENNKKKNKI